MDSPETHLRQALREAVAIEVDSVTVPLFVDFAELYSRQDCAEAAVQLLSFALDHPAMLEYYRMRGEVLLAALAEEIGSERFAAARESGLNDELAAIVKDLILNE